MKTASRKTARTAGKTSPSPNALGRAGTGKAPEPSPGRRKPQAAQAAEEACQFPPIESEDTARSCSAFFCRVGKGLEAIAFDERKNLWYWDRCKWHPITLAGSAQWFADLETSIERLNGSDMIQMGDDFIEWFALVAAELRAFDLERRAA